MNERIRKLEAKMDKAQRQLDQMRGSASNWEMKSQIQRVRSLQEEVQKSVNRDAVEALNAAHNRLLEAQVRFDDEQARRSVDLNKTFRDRADLIKARLAAMNSVEEIAAEFESAGSNKDQRFAVALAGQGRLAELEKTASFDTRREINLLNRKFREEVESLTKSGRVSKLEKQLEIANGELARAVRQAKEYNRRYPSTDVSRALDAYIIDRRVEHNGDIYEQVRIKKHADPLRVYIRESVS